MRDIFVPTSRHCSLQAKKVAQYLTHHIHVLPSLFSMTHFSRIASQVQASHITDRITKPFSWWYCCSVQNMLDLSPKKALIKNSMHKFGGMLHFSQIIKHWITDPVKSGYL